MEKNSTTSLDRTSLLNSFVEFLKEKLGSDLVSVVLFGSAAENRVRVNSDINVLIVLDSSEITVLDKIKSEYRNQHNLIHLSCLFVEKKELPSVCRSFPLKFLDISKRHQVLFGSNVVADFKIDPVHLKFQLQQTVMNLILRLRERYALVSMREEQLIHIMNEFSGPLRSCAFSLMNMQGDSPANPKEALNKFLEKYFSDRAKHLSESISNIRESAALSKDQIEPMYFAYIEILKKMNSVIGN